MPGCTQRVDEHRVAAFICEESHNGGDALRAVVERR
jgi:hypothetical protein